MKPAYKTALIWIGLVLLIILAWRFFALRPDVEEVGLHQLRADVREGRVKDVRVHLKKQQYTYAVEEGDGEPRLHRAVGPGCFRRIPVTVRVAKRDARHGTRPVVWINGRPAGTATVNDLSSCRKINIEIR